MTAIGTVNWGSWDGATLEKLMAVYVAQEHPGVIRREPDSGDGGIDLLIPERGGYCVDQVKSFAGRLGGAQKRQIMKSWQAVNEDPRLDRPITRWRLVLPLDPTPGEQAWIEHLVKEAKWPTELLYKPYWDAMHAAHPHVTDSVIGGGAQRIAKRAESLLRATVVDPTQPLLVDDVVGHFEMLRRQLESEDPHYRYNFRWDDLPPPPDQLQNCVIAETRQVSDGRWLTIQVIAKHSYSLVDAPIMGELAVTIEDEARATEFREAFEAFRDFGRPLDLPEGLAAISLQAPGGLGGTFSGGGGRIVQIPNDVALPDLRLVVLGADGRQRALLGLRSISRTVGLPREDGGRPGVEIQLEDPASVLTGVLRLHPKQTDGNGLIEFNFQLGDLAGRPVVDVLPVMRFWHQAKAGATIQIRYGHGATVLADHQLESDLAYFTVEGLQHAEDLAVLQTYARDAIPVEEEFDPKFAQDLRDEVRLLEGEVITGDSWNDFTATLHPGVDRAEVLARFEHPHLLAIESQPTIELDSGERISMGKRTTLFATMQPAEDQPEDPTQCRFVPGDDRRWATAYGPVTEAQATLRAALDPTTN